MQFCRDSSCETPTQIGCNDGYATVWRDVIAHRTAFPTAVMATCETARVIWTSSRGTTENGAAADVITLEAAAFFTSRRCTYSSRTAFTLRTRLTLTTKPTLQPARVQRLLRFQCPTACRFRRTQRTAAGPHCTRDCSTCENVRGVLGRRSDSLMLQLPLRLNSSSVGTVASPSEIAIGPPAG